MAGHTPGPWKVERRWSNECEIVPRITCAKDDDRGCGWIADIIGAPYLGHESTLPNAYLIAAAPDMLAQLQSNIEDAQCAIETNGPHPECPCWYCKTCAVIAKAALAENSP